MVTMAWLTRRQSGREPPPAVRSEASIMAASLDETA